MPDTKIKRNQNGNWIDIDEPAPPYRTRRQARDARRQRLLDIQHSSHVKRSRTTKLTIIGNTDGTTDLLTPLQQKLYDRFIGQGIDRQETLDVILNKSYGYNQAASYGHMRAAGATSLEASYIIGLSNSQISKAYGQLRASDFTHDTALRFALNGIVPDDNN